MLTCCFCVPLPTGVTVIALSHIVLLLAALVAETMRFLRHRQDVLLGYGYGEDVEHARVVIVAVGVSIGLIINLLLLYAIFVRSRLLLLPWLVYETALIHIALVGLVWSLFKVFSESKSASELDSYLFLLPTLLLGVFLYSWLVVLASNREMKRTRNWVGQQDIYVCQEE